MSTKRLILDCRLSEPVPIPKQPLGLEFRPLRETDVPALAALMLAAYRGEVDDQGETEADALQEVAATLAGKYGKFLEFSSLGLWRSGTLVSAVVTTLYSDLPLFAFCMTAPEFKRKGYCRYLMQQSKRAMLHHGWDRTRLYVTATNTPALNLYRQIGFTDDGKAGSGAS